MLVITEGEQMKRITLIDDMLFCCLTDEYKMELQQDIEQMSYKSTYRYQERLLREKTGYRCSVCGKFYPYLGIRHVNQIIEPEAFSKIQGKVVKYKKAATIFCGNHYYAYNKNTLLKYELDEASVMQQTDMIPIMKDVYHITISLDEKYIATETVKGTVCIVDLETKQTVAKKQKRKVMNSFVFHKDGQKLYYFFEHAIWCWSFSEDRTDLESSRRMGNAR